MQVFSQKCLRYRFVACICLILLFLCSLFTSYSQGKAASSIASHATEQQNQIPALPTKDEAVYYAVSWKKGSRQIQEQKLNIKLSTKYLKYETDIKDSTGTNFYKLVVRPESFDTGEKFWYVKFSQIMDDQYSLLEISRESGHQILIESYFDWLYPTEEQDWRKTGYFGVPLSSTRVFKIENFYCVIQVKSYKINPEEKKALDSVEVEIEFTNNYKLGWRRT